MLIWFFSPENNTDDILKGLMENLWYLKRQYIPGEKKTIPSNERIFFDSVIFSRKQLSVIAVVNILEILIDAIKLLQK